MISRQFTRRRWLTRLVANGQQGSQFQQNIFEILEISHFSLMSTFFLLVEIF